MMEVLDILFSGPLKIPSSLFETITVAKLWTFDVWFAKLFILKGFSWNKHPVIWIQRHELDSAFFYSSQEICFQTLFSINTPVCQRVENTLALKFTLKNKMNIPILFTAELVSVATLFTCCYHSLAVHHWRHSGVHPLLIYCIDDLQYPGWKLFFVILMRSLPCYIQLLQVSTFFSGCA